MPDVATGVPMLDLSGEFRNLEAEWLAAVREAGARGAFILGPNVEAFEREAADYLGVPYAIGVASGTDALLLALRALGVGPGDEVITTAFTFFATAEVITAVGALPVFVDVDEASFALSVDEVRDRIGPRTRAVMPVHLYGHPAPMDALCRLAETHGVAVVEDCAQAFGAVHAGRRVGGFGAAGCFSFYPTKILGAYGDGGLLVTNDAAFAARARRLRNHGASAPFVHEAVGTNSRLDEIQAALLRIKLRRVDAAIAERRRIAEKYNRALSGLDLQVPRAPADGGHVFNLYTIRSPRREAIRRALEAARIGCAVCYPVPLHLQKVYTSLGYRRGDLPVCERLAAEVLSLPIFPGMTDAQIERVCEVVHAALAG